LKYAVVFSPDAEQDVRRLHAYIAERSGEDRALAYISRIEKTCRSLDTLPERGTLRNDLRPGVRTIGFERRVTIAFQVDVSRVVILRILYGGRDVGKAFRKQ
jgi:toxin ParE1/3/4